MRPGAKPTADHDALHSGAGRRVGPTNTFVEFRKEEVEQTIPDRFEQQVLRYPDRTAIKTERHHLTYAELNCLANRVARAILARRGEGAEPVALLLGNDAPAIAAILGVLKAGKIYVPLDPGHPRLRTRHILEDSQASLLVTNHEQLPLAEELARGARPLINLDELAPSLPTANLGLSIPPDALTWILYTSGSTGQPKGVAQSHRNVLHFVMNYANGLRLCPEDRLTLLFSCSVNAGAHDIFSALLNGAALYPLDVKREGVMGLADWLRQHRITVYGSVPTLFRNFADTLTGKEEFPDLRLIKLVGEPVSKRDVEAFNQHFARDCVFVNRLGSTETGTIRWHFITQQTRIEDSAVPVGYPVEGNDILLLDERGAEVGSGEVGEIAVRSRYLSPGYWRQPERTAAAFLPVPGGGDERIYLTGDLGRMLPDGCLECLGRKDFQIKIRGHRVEAEEIELALLGLPAVKEAVVTARMDRPGDQRLVAYLVARDRPLPSISEMRRFLQGRLPDHFVPSSFVELKALPLLPNGKLDRRALPAPGQARPDLETPVIAARTPVEEALAGIWAEVLGVEQVGVQDNFLELGGHSLLAMQVISRVRDAFQVDVSLPSFLEAPRVARLASVVARQLAAKAGPEGLARILAEVESLSDEESQRLLGQAGREGDGR